MKTVIVEDRQTIWDIAVQEYGGVDGVFQLIEDNPGLTIGSDLQGGQLLKIKSAPVNATVLAYMQLNNVKPVSLTQDEIVELNGDFDNDFDNDFNIDI